MTKSQRMKLWIEKNPEKQRQIRIRFRLKRKLEYINLKGGVCVDCGNSDFRVLEFHHKDPKEKEANICNLSRGGVLKELAKCELVCANCHAIRHYEMGFRCLPPKK